MVRSAQQYSQSGRIFRIVFLGHGVVWLQPFLRGKTCELCVQFSVHLVPILLQLSSGRELGPFYLDGR